MRENKNTENTITEINLNIKKQEEYTDKKSGKIIFRLNFIIDLISLLAAFLLASYLKGSGFRNYAWIYFDPFAFFSFLLVAISLFRGKYGNNHRISFIKAIQLYFTTLFIVFSASTTIIYFFKLDEYSRFMVLGTVLIFAGLELVWLSVYYVFVESVIIKESDEINQERIAYKEAQKPPQNFEPRENEAYLNNIESIIEEESSKAVLNFLKLNIDLQSFKTSVQSTTTRFSILKLPDSYYETIINLSRINDIKRINKFFEAVNTKLDNGGLFVCCVETYTQRKRRIMKKYPPVINRLVYMFDFIFKRIAPKMPLTKKIYFWITGGSNRVLSKAETLGRLYSCGFEVVDEKLICQMQWFVVRKKKEPAFDYDPTYGPLIKLKRYGKDGKLFRVYKMRTMHAYSEYIQDYIYQQNDLQEGGKFKDDFRITTLGAIMRKLWIDELPMFINVFRGEMKLVGVRPLSKHYFNLYTEELRQKRIKFKPGLIPPFYADMPKTLEEIMDSEMKYLLAYEKNPLITDWRYFWKAMHNIFIKKARSA